LTYNIYFYISFSWNLREVQEGMALTGDYDLVCCGHSHHLSIQHLTNIKGTQTVLCNPGTVGAVGGLPSTYILADLEKMKFESIKS
jgi:predicted phosphodiesterase